jgi:hypothetical protein
LFVDEVGNDLQAPAKFILGGGRTQAQAYGFGSGSERESIATDDTNAQANAAGRRIPHGSRVLRGLAVTG